MPVSLSIAIAPAAIATGFALMAAYTDLRQRRIPNRLVVAGCAAALAAQLALRGWEGGAAALGGFAVGLVVMVPFYVIGAMGAGDAKLMAMAGTGLGPLGALSAVVLTFLIGGALALAIAAAHGALGRTFGNVKDMLVGALTSAVVARRIEIPAPVTPAGRMPYGVAIALGTLTYVVLTEMGIRIL